MPASLPARLWYYATGLSIRKTLACGRIICTDKTVRGAARWDEEVVWFSSNPAWEATRNGRTFLVPENDPLARWLDLSRLCTTNGPMEWRYRRWLTRDETAEQQQGLYRIEVDPVVRPYSWACFGEISEISPHAAKILVQVALEVGANPEEWWFSLKAVPAWRWVRVEQWNGKEWGPQPPTDWRPSLTDRVPELRSPATRDLKLEALSTHRSSPVGNDR